MLIHRTGSGTRSNWFYWLMLSVLRRFYRSLPSPFENKEENEQNKRKKKEKWVPSFFRPCFTAFLTSTAKCNGVCVCVCETINWNGSFVMFSMLARRCLFPLAATGPHGTNGMRPFRMQIRATNTTTTTLFFCDFLSRMQMRPSPVDFIPIGRYGLCKLGRRSRRRKRRFCLFFGDISGRMQMRPSPVDLIGQSPIIESQKWIILNQHQRTSQ